MSLSSKLRDAESNGAFILFSKCVTGYVSVLFRQEGVKVALLTGFSLR
jgi:hypothetical protein